IWDLRTPEVAESIAPSQQYPVSSIAFSDTNDIVYTGGHGHEMFAWDRRLKRVIYTLSGHIGPITGIRLSPDRSRLLSGSTDNTVRIWSLGPYCEPSGRLLRVLEGAAQGIDEHQSRPAWSNDGLLVSSGSANGTVMVWDTRTGHVLQTLSDHQACVNQVDFHPGERI
ncbi:hypothetical protein BGX33_002630, partial [Mortierella sp. NVP41]